MIMYLSNSLVAAYCTHSNFCNCPNMFDKERQLLVSLEIRDKNNHIKHISGKFCLSIFLNVYMFHYSNIICV